MSTAKPIHLLPFFTALFFLSSCNGQENNNKQTARKASNPTAETKKNGVNRFKEGADYVVYERVRLLDNTGFAEPQEAFSLVFPKGWQSQSDVIWNQPGSACAGTYYSIKARSADNTYSLEMYPDVLYSWNTNTELMRFNQNNSNSANCGYHQPMDAETYLRQVFAAEELGNPEIIKVEPNQYVVQQMAQTNEAGARELRQYGASDVQFHQTAINAVVKWRDGNEGLIVLGVSTIATVLPNAYTGSYDKMFTTQVTKRTLFKYPGKSSEQAKNQFSVIMGSFRSNPAWNNAVNKFWKEVRQQKQIAHIGRIKMMDEQTRQIGEAAMRKGNERLKSMDNDLRTWEASQSSQDRMHTNFIKTIREVENYRDETGKYELTSSYSHAWSRGDGSSFVMSDNPNFDPAFVFQDQNWKQMKKVD
jgi:hypothetical protein